MTNISRFRLKVIPVLLFILLQAGFVTAQHQKLIKKVDSLQNKITGRIGFQVRLLETCDDLGYNQQRHFVMQSVFKFPIAVMLLDEADHGRFSLDQQIFIAKSSLHKTVSKLYEKYPEGNVTVPLMEILGDMLIYSDNNACDIIIGLLGGEKKITDYLHAHGIIDMNIKYNEARMHNICCAKENPLSPAQGHTGGTSVRNIRNGCKWDVCGD